MLVIKTVYVKKLPPKNTVIRLRDAISSCSPEEIKKEHPQPDLHYFEIYWYTKTFGGIQKNILRLLYPSYKIAVEEHNKLFAKLYMNTKDWQDCYYENELSRINKEIKISKENREILKRWKNKYEQNL